MEENRRDPYAPIVLRMRVWSSGEGADQYIRVVPVSRGGRLDGTLEYSGEVDDHVVSTPPTGDDTKTDYHWTDNRCTCETPECKNLYVRLVRKYRDNYWPLVAWLVVLVLAIGLLWLVYRAVYQEHSRKGDIRCLTKHIIVACGGSGIKTIIRLNQLLSQDDYWRRRLDNDVYYVIVDTDVDEMKEFHDSVARDMTGRRTRCTSPQSALPKGRPTSSR